MGLWNSSDRVALLISIWDFGTVTIMWHYLFLYGTLELFRQCGIIGFSFFYWTLELFDIVALFVFIWDFETVLTVWHYLFLYWTLELFRE
jgi:hypothetical protein